MNSEELRNMIDFAIAEEAKAVLLYRSLSGKIKDKGTREMLNDMAAMEKGHEEKLRSFKQGKSGKIDGAVKGPDLKIAEYTVDKPLTEDAGIQDVVLFSIQAEKKANKLYTDMAGACTDSTARTFLLAMADEELRHKKGLEQAYDDNVFREN